MTRRREVLGQAQRVPHGSDVEAAAELEALSQVREVDGQQYAVGDALVSLALEVVLGGPEGVVARPVQDPGYRLGLVEHLGQALVRQPPVVDGRRVEPDLLEVDVTGVQGTESGYHRSPPVVAPF